jgi:hypothetical protein
MRYVANLPWRVRELYCQTTNISLKPQGQNLTIPICRYFPQITSMLMSYFKVIIWHTHSYELLECTPPPLSLSLSIWRSECKRKIRWVWGHLTETPRDRPMWSMNKSDILFVFPRGHASDQSGCFDVLFPSLWYTAVNMCWNYVHYHIWACATGLYNVRQSRQATAALTPRESEMVGNHCFK